MECARSLLSKEVCVKVSSLVRQYPHVLRKPLTRLGQSVLLPVGKSPVTSESLNESAYSQTRADCGRRNRRRRGNVSTTKVEIRQRASFVRGDLDVVTAKSHGLDEKCTRISVAMKKKADVIAAWELEKEECELRCAILLQQVGQMEVQNRDRVSRVMHEAANELRKRSTISIAMFYP